MSKHRQKPNDPAKINEDDAGFSAPPDVTHDQVENQASAEALAGEAIAGSDAPDGRRVEALRQLPDADLLALDRRASEAGHWLDVARRTQAEFENARKRLEREHAENVKYLLSSFARELLTPIDNLERALAAGEKARDFQGFYEGVKLTYQSMLAAMAKGGMAPLEAQGKPFDPNEHDAVMMGNDAKLADNSVAQVFESGWKIHERVLRPAKVMVNKKT